MWRYLSIIIYKLIGWKVEGKWPDKKKFIVISAPHTSGLDFPIGLMMRSITRKNVLYVAKKEMFKFPFGPILKWIGGYPVDRTRKTNFTQAVAEIYNSKDEFAICIAPEGTRNKVDKLKTGYWYIAKAANVPIVHVGLDWGNKQVIIDEDYYYPTNIEADMHRALKFFGKLKGRNPELDLRPVSA